ncbi:MAG TPA: TIM-barrel domain-containing protein [Candidatus Angelobacter sp.]|nr:TIM-barrel domain-containing protein [Candidatus Angelobacter sp.]
MSTKFHSIPFRHHAPAGLQPRILAVLMAAAAALPIFPAIAAGALNESVVVGDVRAQLLSDSLVRLELRGPEGFENRPTFHVLERKWPGVSFTTVSNANEILVRTPRYIVHIPAGAKSLDGVSVESPDEKILYAFDGKLQNSKWLPSPEEKPLSWSFADSPRIIPPAWGATPIPAGSNISETSGWDLSNNAPDIYVFVPGGNYHRLRADFLKLTGPTEMPPLFAFGAFDSRWYDYSETTALQQIDDYRAHKIPLDVLVVDTGWRQGASTGYRPNTNLFPDMRRFLAEAHAKNVRVLFNDHPEPKGNGLKPVEMNYRYDGLSGLLNEGLDVWWYDRNWSVALVPPLPGLKKEVWGMRLYHDITQQVRPGQRPLIMANVDGIDNGVRKRPPNVAAHRFPFQWTGDIAPDYKFLRFAVENAVHSGVQSLFPYESDDLGGHIADPTPEQYIRWAEYGALSPIYRPHCTHNLMRMPWTFGPEVENTARHYVNMRYRLLPVFYAAARENYETGEPLLRRLDLDYPQFSEASHDDEYLLGENILVAPVVDSPLNTVPPEWLKSPDGQPGLRADYFANENLSGAPILTRTDKAIDFDWNYGSPGPGIPNDHFSARWTGSIEVPPKAGDIILATLEDDGARVWVDDKQIIDAWGAHDAVTSEASSALSPGKHQLRVEYLEQQYKASLRLQFQPPGKDVARQVWIPPGHWINAWDGNVVSGPEMITNATPLEQIPLFIRSGTILPLAPEMEFTGQKPWSPITLDIYPQTGETNSTIIYEDDGQTTAYRAGKFRKTLVTVSSNEQQAGVTVEIGAAKGDFQGALPQRGWILRFHSQAGWPSAPSTVHLNGKKIAPPFHHVSRNQTAMPFGDQAGSPDGDIFELALPTAPVAKAQRIEISCSEPPRSLSAFAHR